MDDLKQARSIPACDACRAQLKFAKNETAINMAAGCDKCLELLFSTVVQKLADWMRRAEEALAIVEQQNEMLKKRG